MSGVGWRCVLLLAALAAGLSPQARQSVPLTVVVTTGDGRVVEGLTPADFVVRLDGQPVEVVSSERISRAAPLLILIDVSVSWSQGQNRETRRLLRTEILELRRHDEPVRVMGFGRQLRGHGPFTSEVAEQTRQIDRAFAIPAEERSGPSPLWDVLNEALEEGPVGEVFDVWMITDGQATGNRLRLGQVADRAIAANVAVHSLFVGSSGQMPQHAGNAILIRPQASLEQLARGTGGLFVERSYEAPVSFGNVRALPTQNAPNPLRAATLALRHRYQLMVSAPVRDGFQRVEVSTHDAGHQIRSRLGLVTTPSR